MTRWSTIPAPGEGGDDRRRADRAERARVLAASAHNGGAVAADRKAGLLSRGKSAARQERAPGTTTA